MLFIACPTRGAELIPESHIRSLTNTDHGIVVTLDCYCGHQHKVVTGRRSELALAA